MASKKPASKKEDKAVLTVEDVAAQDMTAGT